MTRVPTRKQYAQLSLLGNPEMLAVSADAGPARRRRIWERCLDYGWVEPACGRMAYLRALADALERYGREEKTSGPDIPDLRRRTASGEPGR